MKKTFESYYVMRALIYLGSSTSACGNIEVAFRDKNYVTDESAKNMEYVWAHIPEAEGFQVEQEHLRMIVEDAKSLDIVLLVVKLHEARPIETLWADLEVPPSVLPEMALMNHTYGILLDKVGINIAKELTPAEFSRARRAIRKAGMELYGTPAIIDRDQEDPSLLLLSLQDENGDITGADHLIEFINETLPVESYTVGVMFELYGPDLDDPSQPFMKVVSEP